MKINMRERTALDEVRASLVGKVFRTKFPIDDRLRDAILVTDVTDKLSGTSRLQCSIHIYNITRDSYHAPDTLKLSQISPISHLDLTQVEAKNLAHYLSQRENQMSAKKAAAFGLYPKSCYEKANALAE